MENIVRQVCLEDMFHSRLAANSSNDGFCFNLRELLNEKESTKPSFHDKIRIANVREYDYTEVSKQIDDLIEKSKLYDEMLTVKKMKEIVPEYKSNNSIYEKLDK